MFVKRGDNQQIKLVDPDEVTPEQKELVKEVSEQNESLEHQKENGTQPSN